MKTSNPQLDKAFNDILNCFTGTDGGVSFVKLRSFIEEMERRDSLGDKDAGKILSVVIQMGRMIEVSNDEF